MTRLSQDPRLRNVRWQDLCHLTPLDALWELVLPVPWLVLSWVLAAYQAWPPALGCSFVFFLCALRVNHNACHYALGLPRRGHELAMGILSGLILGSNHAVQFNHLRHHRHCLGPEDLEARSARMNGWQALGFGPLFPLLLVAHAWRLGSRRLRGWLLLELVLNALALWVAFGLSDWAWLKFHYLAMAAGQCLTAFFAVWTVHHDCHAEADIARTIRSRLKSVLVFDMFYHLEHHLFPRVPTRRLHVLARRLDAALPDLPLKRVY